MFSFQPSRLHETNTHRKAEPPSSAAEWHHPASTNHAHSNSQETGRWLIFCSPHNHYDMTTTENTLCETVITVWAQIWFMITVLFPQLDFLDQVSCLSRIWKTHSLLLWFLAAQRLEHTACVLAASLLCCVSHTCLTHRLRVSCLWLILLQHVFIPTASHTDVPAALNSHVLSSFSVCM